MGEQILLSHIADGIAASIEKWDYSTWSEREVDYYRLNHGFVCETMERAVALTEKMLVAINEQ